MHKIFPPKGGHFSLHYFVDENGNGGHFLIFFSEKELHSVTKREKNMKKSQKIDIANKVGYGKKLHSRRQQS